MDFVNTFGLTTLSWTLCPLSSSSRSQPLDFPLSLIRGTLNKRLPNYLLNKIFYPCSTSPRNSIGHGSSVLERKGTGYTSPLLRQGTLGLCFSDSSLLVEYLRPSHPVHKLVYFGWSFSPSTSLIIPNLKGGGVRTVREVTV